MRILIASTPVAPIGEGTGGGVDLTVNILAKEFSNKNHSVEIIAPQGSKVAKNIPLIEISGTKQALAQYKTRKELNPVYYNSILANMWDYILKNESNYDVIINFAYDWLPFYLNSFFKTKILHFISMSSVSDEMDLLIKNHLKTHPNTISMYTKAQLETFDLNENVHILGMGIELEKYTFSESFNNSISWVGRISKEKGLEDAFEVAKKTKMSLKIMGKIQDESYWNDLTEKYKMVDVEYLGFLNTEQLQKELGKTKVMIFTSKWIEAFGIVIIEALACGVPVISYNIGGPSEIIKDNKTGFLVPKEKGVIGILEKISALNSISRADCHKYVSDNYSSKIFAEKILSIIKQKSFAKI